MATPVTYRPATDDDRPLADRTLYLALSWDPEDPIPPMDVVVSHPKIAVYVEGWMRPGDAGFVAEKDGAFVGMAFCRRFDDGTDAQGFYDSETPELAVGVEHAFRGQGVGGQLITLLSDVLAASGVERMSLSVATANPALALYRRLGYREVRGGEDDLVMVVDL